jgi:hypothetical protein
LNMYYGRVLVLLSFLLHSLEFLLVKEYWELSFESLTRIQLSLLKSDRAFPMMRVKLCAQSGACPAKLRLFILIHFSGLFKVNRCAMVGPRTQRPDSLLILERGRILSL